MDLKGEKKVMSNLNENFRIRKKLSIYSGKVAKRQGTGEERKKSRGRGRGEEVPKKGGVPLFLPGSSPCMQVGEDATKKKGGDTGAPRSKLRSRLRRGIDRAA